MEEQIARETPAVRERTVGKHTEDQTSQSFVFPQVSLQHEGSDPLPITALTLRCLPTTVDEALELARDLGKVSAQPGTASTRDRWEALATLAAGDLGAARAIEPHLDALAILAEAGEHVGGFREDTLTWGVFAAEGGDDPLSATQVGNHWSLTGTKPWCSLADRLDYALVTAHLEDGDRALFAVDLRSEGVDVLAGQWHARGLAEVPSGPVVLRGVNAIPIGEPGWYLRRPGFAWGGIGVAACWYGGAVGIARTLFARAGARPEPLIAAHLGAVDEQLQCARRALAEAADIADREPEYDEPSILAKRVRATVARVCESVLTHAAHALGPAPLALDEVHAKRVADLELYIRQHHAEKDDASLGVALARRGALPW